MASTEAIRISLAILEGGTASTPTDTKWYSPGEKNGSCTKMQTSTTTLILQWRQVTQQPAVTLLSLRHVSITHM